MEALISLAQIPPPWLDKAFFEKVVKVKENDPEAVVEEFNVTPGSKPGDNFASAIFRVSIKFKSKHTDGTKTISTVLKVQPNYPPEMAHLQNNLIFKNETEMYGKVLPEILELWKAAGDVDALCPK